MAYAEGTSVSVEKSIQEIIGLIKKRGANRIVQAEEPGYIAVQFFLNERLLRFKVTLPDWQEVPKYNGQHRFQTDSQRQAKAQQRAMQRARALLLVIKAKLESVESGVETFEEAFLSNIVTPGGATVGDWLIPQIEEGYRIGAMPQQLMLTSAPQ